MQAAVDKLTALIGSVENNLKILVAQHREEASNAVAGVNERHQALASDTEAKLNHQANWWGTLNSEVTEMKDNLTKRIEQLESARSGVRKSELMDRKELRDLKPYSGDVKLYYSWKSQAELFLERHDDRLPGILLWVEGIREEELTSDNFETYCTAEHVDLTEGLGLLNELYHFLFL